MRLRELWPEFSVIGFCLAVLTMPTVAATTSQSSTYQLDESSIGTSNPLDVQSQSYGLTSASGDLAVGNSTSDNYQINAGSKTSPDPVLSFSVDSAAADFGELSPASTATTTLTFTVRDYTTYGYIVQIFGDGPTNNSHVLTPLATPTTSQAGVEQFGINLVANTSPTNVGANPDNGEFGNGSATSDYSQTNLYKYTNGDTIASAPGDSGETTYTITYIANVSPLTAAGHYRVSQTLIATGTY